jgi:hypothetical protein
MIMTCPLRGHFVIESNVTTLAIRWLSARRLLRILSRSGQFTLSISVSDCMLSVIIRIALAPRGLHGFHFFGILRSVSGGCSAARRTLLGGYYLHPIILA